MPGLNVNVPDADITGEPDQSPRKRLAGHCVLTATHVGLSKLDIRLEVQAKIEPPPSFGRGGSRALPEVPDEYECVGYFPRIKNQFIDERSFFGVREVSIGIDLRVLLWRRHSVNLSTFLTHSSLNAHRND